MMAESARTVSVVIPTCNGLPLLRYTLASLQYQRAPAAAYEVVVVDDASADGTWAWLASYRPPYALTRLRNPGRLGRSVTRNRGIEAAAGDIVLFIDGDTICPPTLVPAHLGLHAGGHGRGLAACVTGYPWFWRSVATWRFSRPRRALVDPELLSRWEDFEDWAGGPLGPPDAAVAIAGPEAPFTWCITRALSVPRRLVVELGGFDTRFRGYGWEDFEFGYRLYQRGVRVLAHPTAAVFHQDHPVAAGNSVEMERNYAVFLALHPDFKVALLTVHPRTTGGPYRDLCGAHDRLRHLTPALAAAIEEVVVDYAWARQRRLPDPLRGWAFWSARWGPERCRRIEAEQLTAMRDRHGAELTSTFRRLAGYPGARWGGGLVGRPR